MKEREFAGTASLPREGMLKNRVYSVGQVNRYVKNMFVQDFFLQKLAVKGEVSNLKYHTSGHIYFSLKDETGVLSCVMFAGNRRGLSFRMKDGDKIIAKGTVDVYERDGRYQLYVKEITLEALCMSAFLRLSRSWKRWACLPRSTSSRSPGLSKSWGL